MDEITLIQDLAIVLLTAGIAGTLCRRLGLSVIVGYLLAGILIGPFTPPFSFITDVGRIQTLSQVGLVFLMFGIGLGLSLGKLGRMGWPTLLATGLGAFLMLNLVQLVGLAVGWTGTQSLFLAGMVMVSSSAVIAKVVGELNLTHERPGQLALGVTVLEDVVAVIMLTVLGAKVHGGGETVGSVLTGMTAFIVLLVGAGLLMVPRLMRRLEARADPELQTIIVAGLLFLLSMAAVKAGYSLALGAFLLGAIVAEIPQKASVEKAFAGMRDVFSSVFFVSIGMMIDLKLLAPVWPWVIAIGAFALIARALVIGFALILCGTKPTEARRAGLLLGPLGEFTFIIAQLGVSASILPGRYYPMAVGVSIFTVLMVPLVNRRAEGILRFTERIEPSWLQRALDAYHSWLEQVRSQPTSSLGWKLVRGRLAQTGLEMLFVTGVMLFSHQLLDLLMENAPAFGLKPTTVSYVFWSVISVIALIPLVAIWRNLGAIAMIIGESVSRASRLPAPFVRNSVIALSVIGLGYWLYAIVPTDQLGVWGWGVIALAATIVVAIFSRRLIYWHSHWQSSLRDVLAEDVRDIGLAAARVARGRRQQDLDRWDLHLREVVVPDAATYGGQTLAQLSIPFRFGCAVLELERNGHVITTIGPDLRVYPGDKILLLGPTEQLTAASVALVQGRSARNESEQFLGSVLENFHIPPGAHSGHTLADLKLAQLTGTRVVGIERTGQKIIAPSGQEKLLDGDNVLVAGTLAEISAFRRWLKTTH